MMIVVDILFWASVFYLVAGALSAPYFAWFLYREFYEPEGGCDKDVSMTGGAVAQFAILGALLWPWAWYGHLKR